MRTKRVRSKEYWRWPIAVAVWFVSSFWAMMYWNLEGGHLYHRNHGGPIAASIAGILCVLTTVHVVRTFFAVTSRNRP